MESRITIQGIAQKGHNRGKKLGFPTINMPLSKQVEEGIYISKITIDEKTYNALTFIGTAKTFDETIYQAETYVFDFNQDVYGKSVTVELLKKIRENMKFDSEQALMQQMETDKRQAEEFFKKI